MAASFLSCIKQLACAPQAGSGAQPKRRYGLLGLMKRNKSEIGTHSLVPPMFNRFHAHAQQEVYPKPIAENGTEDDDHDDLFASPRCLTHHAPVLSNICVMRFCQSQQQASMLVHVFLIFVV